MDSNKIAIIGAGSMGKAVAMAMAIAENTNNICILYNVVDSQFADLREPKPFLITRLPKFKEPWIDPNEPVINYKKHEQACTKNRKKRKKRKKKRRR